MTDLETAIMIKNMARETVRQMTAKVKNAVGVEVTYQTDDGKTGTYRTSVNAPDDVVKEYFQPGNSINIGTGGRDRMVTIKSVKFLK